MAELKDNIDFGKERVSTLFNKLLYPTLAGMVFGMLFNIVDGMFVGRFIGSDALAAVNVAAPMFQICIGVSLMLGIGGSVIASIHLSHDKVKTARIVATQSVLACALILLIVSIVVLAFPERILRLFGCTPTLILLAKNYLYGYVPFLALNGVFTTGEFFLRLSGEPKKAMVISIVTAVLNMCLDALMIIVLRMGTFGAALATGISLATGGLWTLICLLSPRMQLRLIKLKLHKRAMALTFRNIGYMMKLGFSTLIGELAIAFIITCGNRSFASLSGDSGIAAFSVVCYLMPVVFMLYGAISQSAQPIISFNHGAGDEARVSSAYKYTLKIGMFYAVGLLLGAELLAPFLVSVFIESADPSYGLAVTGLRLFSLAVLPFAYNMMRACYFQSVERPRNAVIITVLRGYIFYGLLILILPKIFGITGAWLAVLGSEVLTFFVAISITPRRSNLPGIPSHGHQSEEN